MRRLFVVFAVALLAIAGAVSFALTRSSAQDPGWRVEKVAKGPLVSAVSATGRLRAVVTVQVGSQVSGQIGELLADFNQEVTAGQPVARLDARSYRAKLRQAEAEKRVAEAAVAQREAEGRRAEAEIVEARSTLAEAIRDLARVEPLQASGHAALGRS
ncbi:MAG: biotin/lipoyl-binding protein, partial [Alphaproteobacteria bacterium]|nr:biotin/lipoyl-binding protein [Alphaproteobacteria bacterium]